MVAVLLAVLPAFLLIFLGYICKARNFPGEGFWPPAERLTYFVLFPALLIGTLARADLGELDVLAMAAAIAGAILVMTAVLLLLRPRIALDGPAFTSLYQGAVRMNTYIGLSISFGLYGTAGLAAAAVAVAVIVPLVNFLCVLLLTMHGHQREVSVLGAVRQIARNPLLLSSLLGAFLNVTGLGLPPVIDELLRILATAALPLGLLAVGAALDLSAAKQGGKPVIASAALKLLAMPALTATTCWTFGIEGIGAAVAILFNGLPTAPSAYILARQLGGDAKLMASLISVQTSLALFSLPLVIAVAAWLFGA